MAAASPHAPPLQTWEDPARSKGQQPEGTSRLCWGRLGWSGQGRAARRSWPGPQGDVPLGCGKATVIRRVPAFIRESESCTHPARGGLWGVQALVGEAQAGNWGRRSGGLGR